MGKSTISVAVIGSGPAGLAAADSLCSAGFEVTVFDKNSEAGGKVKTVQVGDAQVDVGAIAGVRGAGPFGTDFDPIFELTDRYGIRTRRFTHVVTYDVQRGTYHFGVRLRDALGAAAPLAKYLLMHRFRWRGHREGEIGDELSPELKQPWSELLRSTGLESIARAFQTFLVSAGYPPDMAAFHQASYLDPGIILAVLLRRGVETWVGGYQQVFKRLQAELAERGVSFRFRHAVQSIKSARERADRAQVTVVANGESLRFDEVFVACDVGPLLRHGVLDISDEYRSILEQLHDTLDYRSVVCRVQGLPDFGRVSIGHVPAHARRAGWPVLYCQQVPGLYVWYVEGSDRARGRLGREEIEANLRTTVARIVPGARLQEVEHYAEWDYAPHPSADAVRAGVLHALKAKQGTDGLTFLLAAASFETTARAMQNARAVTSRLLPVIQERHHG